MDKAITLKLSESEFSDLISAIDTLSAMLNGDDITRQEIKRIDAMLLKNGFKRKKL